LNTSTEGLEHCDRVPDETSVSSFREEREFCSTESVDDLERAVSRFDSNVHDFGHSTWTKTLVVRLWMTSSTNELVT
jgi:hypothetical protein